MSWRFERYILASVCALAFRAFAQSGTNLIQSQASLALASHFTTASGMEVLGVPIEAFRRNQPLSLSLTAQALADRTHVSRVMHERLYRDSWGRVRLETFDDSGHLSTICLMDPVAGKVVYLSVVDKQESSIDSLSSRMMNDLTARYKGRNIDPVWPGETIEPLAAKTLQGFTADGTRRTRCSCTLPGNANEQPINEVGEEWFSPQLGIDLQQSVDDPRAGKATITASEIQLKEPDPALFQVPSDYTVVPPPEVIAFWR